MKRSDFIAVGILLEELHTAEMNLNACGGVMQDRSVEVVVNVRQRIVDSDIRNQCIPVLNAWYKGQIAVLWNKLEDLGVEP